MNINSTIYDLEEGNYFKEETEKKKIVLLNTFNDGMNHFNGWRTRMNGDYKYTTAYTIDREGYIFEHFNPKYWSKMFNRKVDKEIIGISLVNQGYLKMENPDDGFITWLRDIYNGEEVFEKRWRGYRYWEPYTDAQKNSTVTLVEALCDGFGIECEAVPYNVRIDAPDAYNGVMYRSNFDNYYSDLSPAWDFTLFTETEKV